MATTVCADRCKQNIKTQKKNCNERHLAAIIDDDVGGLDVSGNHVKSFASPPHATSLSPNSFAKEDRKQSFYEVAPVNNLQFVTP